jgi:hypothetical protein
VRADHDQHPREADAERGPPVDVNALAEEHHREHGEEHRRGEGDRGDVGQRQQGDRHEQAEHAHRA